MKKIFLSILLFAGLSLGFSACFGGGSDSESSSENTESSSDNSGSSDEVTSVEEATKQVQDAMKQLNDGKEVEVVNFRELKKLLPKKVAGLPQTDSGGETTGAMGMTISTAEGKYQEEDKTVEVNIIDTGGLGMALMGMAAWSSVTIDRETDEGYERTTTFKGHKAFEKYEKNRDRSEFSILIDKRFVVQLTGRNVSMDDLKDAAKKMDLGDL